jgi:hypothetical protein
MGKTSNLKDLRGKPERYVWGKIVKIHDIGEYSIIESINTFGEQPTMETEYHPYINEKNCMHGFTSMDAALAHAIAYKHDGCNTRADRYFLRGIGAI